MFFMFFRFLRFLTLSDPTFCLVSPAHSAAFYTGDSVELPHIFAIWRGNASTIAFFLRPLPLILSSVSVPRSGGNHPRSSAPRGPSPLLPLLLTPRGGYPWQCSTGCSTECSTPCSTGLQPNTRIQKPSYFGMLQQSPKPFLKFEIQI